MNLRQYLLREQIAGPAIVNLLLNAGIAWAVFREDRVPVWGNPSLAVDLGFTMFLFPFLLCLIVSLVARNDLRIGKAPLVAQGELRPRWLKGMPGRLLPRALVFGLVGLVVGMPILLGLLKASGAESFGRIAVIWGKAAAMAVTAPFLAMATAQLALSDPKAQAISQKKSL